MTTTTKRIFLPALSIAALLILSGCQGGGSGPMKTPKTEEDKTFYTVGSMFGSRLKEWNSRKMSWP